MAPSFLVYSSLMIVSLVPSLARADPSGNQLLEQRACAQCLVESIVARTKLGALELSRLERYASALGTGDTYYRFEARQDAERLSGYIYPKLLEAVEWSSAKSPSYAPGECTLNTNICGASFELRDEKGNPRVRLGRECGLSWGPRPAAAGPR